MTRHTAHPPAATCTYALRMLDGRLVADPDGKQATYDLGSAYLWLWPAAESDEARAVRVGKVVERYPWIGQAVAMRARA